MNSTNGRPADELIARYVAGEASAAEIREVEAWAGERTENEQELREWMRTWELTAQPFSGKLDTDAAWRKVKQEAGISSIPEAVIRPLSRKVPWLRIAAILVVAVSAIVLVNRATKPDRKIVQAGAEGREVILPDSSVVLLSPNSEISWPENFSDDERAVSLNGAAFFEVRESPSRPFVVDAGYAFVRVLGTSFIVNAREKQVNVSVQTGKVLVSHEKAEAASSDSSAVVLLNGMRAEIRKEVNKIKVQEADPVVERYAFDQHIVFTNTALHHVAATLSRVFKKEIRLSDPAIGNCRLTATFRDQELKEVLEIIAHTFNLEIKENGETVTFYGQGC